MPTYANPDARNCFDCPEDKICCVLSISEYDDFLTLYPEQRALVVQLVKAGMPYEKAKLRVLMLGIE